MPIDPEYPGNQQGIGRHNQGDGQHYHFVWGPRSISDASTSKDVKQIRLQGNEELVPVCTMVAVDWDSCVAVGSCTSKYRLEMIRESFRWILSYLPS